MGQYLFIVAQDKPDLCEYLTGWFGGIPTVQVVIDRRQAERRRRSDSDGAGRRQSDRRTQREVAAEIRQTGFAIVGAPPTAS